MPQYLMILHDSTTALASMSPDEMQRVIARYKGWSDKLGTVEAGKWADIVAVPGNPLEDVTRLGNVQYVMKDGVSYAPGERAL